MANSISSKIIKNTVFNAIGRFWGILIALLLTPYIIHIIGVERYGVWTLVGATTSYFGLFDFGVGTSFVKYISEFHAKEDRESINQVVNTGLIFYSLMAVFLMLLGWAILSPLLSLLGISASLRNEAGIVLMLGIVLFAAASVLSVFAAIQVSLQRMDLSNKLAIAMTIPSIAGTVFFLEKGFGLVGLMANSGIVLALSSAANVAIAFKILPGLELGPSFFSRRMLRKLVGFGWNMQISNLANLLVFQGDKIIIAHFLNVELVSFYQLGKTIIDKTRELPLMLVSAIVPAASEMGAKGDSAMLEKLYLRGGKYLAVTGLPLLALVFASAPLIMAAWIGPGCTNSVLVIRLMAPAYMINYLTGMATSIAFGLGKPQLQMKASVFYMAANIGLSVVLAMKFGFQGVVWAMFLSLSLSSSYFMVLFHGHFPYPFLDLIKRSILPPFIVSAFLGAGIMLFNRLVVGNSSARVYCLSVLAAETLLFLSAYVMVISAVGYLDGYDRALLKDKFPFVRKLL